MERTRLILSVAMVAISFFIMTKATINGETFIAISGWFIVFLTSVFDVLEQVSNLYD